MLLFVCLLGLFAPSFSLGADSNGSGSCSGSPSSPIEQTLGSWHEYARIPNAFQPGFVCLNFTYFENDNDGFTVHVDATIRLSGAEVIWESHFGGSPIDGAYVAKFPKHATVQGTRNRFLVSKSKRWMLWQMCLDQTPENLNQPLVWLLSKTTELRESELRQINRALLSWKIRSNMLEKTDETDCPNYHDITGVHLEFEEE